MENKPPKVSVIMPVYNGEKFLREAIDSILAQTFSNFELIVIDDCSSDESAIIAKSIADQRVLFVRNDRNLGSSLSRNAGIKIARGEYIAFLDADDRACPERLAKQSAWLDTHLNFGLIGSALETIDENGHPIQTGGKWQFTAWPEEIPAIMLFTNYFALSAVMLRKSALPADWFQTEFIPSEDYELWIRIAQNWPVWNLPEVLTKYRIHGDSLSKVKADHYDTVMPKIYAGQFDRLGLNYSPEDLEFHYKLCYWDISPTSDNVAQLKDWFKKIYIANQRSGRYDQAMLLKSLISRWIAFGRQSNWIKLKKLRGFPLWREIYEHPVIALKLLSLYFRKLFQ